MTQDIATLGLRIDARQVRDADRALDDFRRRGAGAENQVDRTNAAMARMARMAAAVAAALSANEIIKQADAWANLQGRLSLVVNSQQQLLRTTEALFDLSQRTRSDLSETATLYTKIARSTADLNKTDAERLRLTETINKATIISGATSATAAAGLQQLGQALGSGVLRGEEFNSVMENTPRLAQALASGMGKTTAELRAMAEAGKLSTEVVLKALESQAGAIDAEFSRLPTTVGQAMTQIQNSFLRTVGVFDQQNKLSASFAEGLGAVAAHMQQVAAVAAVLAGSALLVWLNSVRAAIWGKVAAMQTEIALERAAAAARVTATTAIVAQTGAQVALTQARLAELRAVVIAAPANERLFLTMTALVPAQTRAAAASAAHTAALTAQAAATTAAAGVAGLASRALAFIGGPLGAVTIALTAGAAAWAWWSNRAKTAETEVAATLEETTNEIIADLDKQIKKYEERNRIAKMIPEAAKGESRADEQRRAILTKINQVSKDASLTDVARTEILRSLGGQYAELTQKMDRATKAQADNVEIRNTDKHAAWLAKNSQYLTQTEKLAQAMKEAQAELGSAFTPADEARIRAAFAAKDADLKNGNDAVKQSREYIQSLKDERAAIGATESQQRMMAAAKAAAVAPTAALAAETMVEARALNKATEAHEASLKSIEALDKLNKEYSDGLNNVADIRKASLKTASEEADRNEELARTFGLTRAEIERLELARLQEQLAQRASLGLTLDEIAHLEQLIATKQRSADAISQVEALEKQKSAWESVEEVAHDTFVSIFDSGKSAFDRLRDTLKNGLMDLLYQMTVKKWIFNIGASVTGSAAGGMAQAAGSAVSGGSSLLGNAGGALSLASIASGAFQTAGAIMSGTVGFGSTLSAGMAAIGTGTASGIAAGLSSVAGALGPIALALGAAVMIWKKLDTSGTSHTGGAAFADSSGSRSIRAESIGFEHTKVNADTEKMVTAMAQSVVGILDSTALAFGKTAGYSAATAFADDTSKDGAWGSLVIKKMDQTLVDWNKTRTSNWAPKEFSDGEAGQKQYLAALSASVRTALDGIGLPAWAKTMLDGVGQGATIEELAKVVDQINLTQRALASMKEQIPGFVTMTDAAVSALMAASGGIEALATNAGAYFDGFMTEGEKTAALSKQVAEALATVGLQMPATVAAYRAQVEAQMAMGAAGAPALAMLFKYAGAFKQLHPEVEAANNALQDRADLESRLADAMLSEAAKVERARAKLDPSLHYLYDQVIAAEAAQEAQAKARDTLRTLADDLRSFAGDVSGFSKSMLTGSLSPLTQDEQYAELRRQYEATSQAAMGGDAKAQQAYTGIAQAFLTASQKRNGGDAAYSADFAAVLAMNEQLAKYATTGADQALAQLAAMERQVAGIDALNATLARVEAHMATLAAPQQSPIAFRDYGTANTEPLVAEIKSMRDELVKTQEQNERLTADLAQAITRASVSGSKAIVSGVGDAVRETPRVTERKFSQ